MKFENSLPTKAVKNINGIKPINVVKINFILDIDNIERQMFWAIKGGPGINLKIIKYSIDEFFIILLIFFEYFK